MDFPVILYHGKKKVNIDFSVSRRDRPSTIFRSYGAGRVHRDYFFGSDKAGRNNIVFLCSRCALCERLVFSFSAEPETKTGVLLCDLCELCES